MFLSSPKFSANFLTCSLMDGVQLMIDFGICFPINSAKRDLMFLFPSLCPVEGMLYFIQYPRLTFTIQAFFKFTAPSQPGDNFCGIQIRAPNRIIFIPGFICKLFVEVLMVFNVCCNKITSNPKVFIQYPFIDTSQRHSSSSRKWYSISLPWYFQW